VDAMRALEVAKAKVDALQRAIEAGLMVKKAV
jgi:hypothetical protein